MSDHFGVIKSYPTLDKLFNDDYFIKYNAKLALLIGKPAAIMIQQILYWVELNEINDAKSNKERDGHLREGYTWMYNSVTKWHAQLPCMSISTITRALDELEKLNFIIIGRFNPMKRDRTKWFRPNLVELARFEETHHSELINGSTHSEQIHSSKMSEPLPKNTIEKHRENSLSKINSSQLTPDQKKEVKENTDTSRTTRSSTETSDFSTPLTQLQLWEIAGEMDVSLVEVSKKYTEIMSSYEAYKAKRFYNKRDMKHLLKDFIRGDIQKHFITTMNSTERMGHRLDHPNERLTMLKGLVIMSRDEGNNEESNKYIEQYKALYSEGARETEK